MERVSNERLEQLISSHALWNATATVAESAQYHKDDADALRELLERRKAEQPSGPVNNVEAVEPNPGNENGAKCEICGALLVCLSCGNHAERAGYVKAEQPTGQQETIDRAAERVATWPEWKRNAVRYRDDSDQQAGAEIPAEQMSDEQLDAALQAYGLDLQAVLKHGFNGICKALLNKSEELIRAEAELVQIKERYATYRAAATAQAKLFAAQIEILKMQLRDNDLAFAHANELIGKYMKDADDLKEELAAAQRERDELLSRYAFVENQHLCVGYKGKCDGDLEGIAHKETCPAREKDEILRPHLYQTPSDQGAKNP